MSAVHNPEVAKVSLPASDLTETLKDLARRLLMKMKVLSKPLDADGTEDRRN